VADGGGGYGGGVVIQRHTLESTRKTRTHEHDKLALWVTMLGKNVEYDARGEVQVK
jgi:hypothetical protein